MTSRSVTGPKNYGMVRFTKKKSELIACTTSAKGEMNI